MSAALASLSGSGPEEDACCPWHNEKPVYLFEISHEVAKKSGGIYTVISSKAKVTVQEWGDHYNLLGPFNASTAAIEFEPLPASELSQKILDRLRDEYKIIAHYGRWLVPGQPHVFLFELSSSFDKLPAWRRELQGDVAVESDKEANDAIILGYQVATFFKILLELAGSQMYAVAHFHEWLGSVGLLVMKMWKLPIPTIFTTHATLLGRYLSAGGADLIGALNCETLDIDKEAGTRGIYNRHWLEVGACRGADVFTAVSEITSAEAKKLLGREADVITPNGLNTGRYTAIHEFQNLHRKYRDVLGEFVRGHFFGCYDFDLEKTLYFFTAGRREYLNKGVDLMIDALSELNGMLKRDGIDVTVVAFIIMPGSVNNVNVESIRGQSNRRQIRETCDDIAKKVADGLYEQVLRGNMPDLSSLVSKEDLITLKRRLQLVVQTTRLPPIVTHNVINDGADEILNHLRRVQLFNMKDDRVKVVYHPEFVNAMSPILPLDYPEFVRGCHLGIFCSYYEPWGYTPAECALSGVPSVSSNLTGFASYMGRRLAKPEEHGLYIVDRIEQSYEDSVHQLANCLYRFCQQNRRQRIEQRNKTEQLSTILSWEAMYRQYVIARNNALNKAYGFSLPMPHFLTKDRL